MKKNLLLLSLSFSLLIAGCSSESPTASGLINNKPSNKGTAITNPVKQDEPYSRKIFAMDTVIDFTVYNVDVATVDESVECIRNLEKLISTTQKDSEVYILNESKSAVFSDITKDLLLKSLDLCKKTNGALDITMYPITKAWGFISGNNTVPSNSTITALLENTGYSRIHFDSKKNICTLDPNFEIDFGSVAKGYVGDKVVDILKNAGVQSALINLGGNVMTIGSKPDGEPWKISIQNPLSDGTICNISVSDKAVVTSGIYERNFIKNGVVYGHIMDPKTGKPAKSGLSSVTIIGENGFNCDALSTALYVLGLENAKNIWKYYHDFDMILIDDEGKLYITDAIYDSFSLSEIAQSTQVEVISFENK